MAKTSYSHHISYWSNWRPSSVTSTNNSTWASTTRAVWGSSSKSSWSSSSKSSWSSSSSSWWTYKYNPTTGYYERTDWGTNTYAGKWWSTVTVWWWKVTTTWWSWGWSSRTVTGWYMQNWKLYNEYSDWTTGLASESWWAWSKGNTSKLSSNISSNSNVWEKKKEDYTSSSWENYTNAYNHYKEQWMSDADARTQASAFLENENLLWWNKKEDAPMIENNDEDEFDPMDVINWVMEEWEDEYYDDNVYQDYEDLFWDWADRYEKKIADLESQLESQTIKSSIPEERDTSYDYNTYYQENLAPNTNYENWESKNTLNDKPQTTLVSQYQEPVTTALNDLGLLTPNEEASSTIPWTEEDVAPAQYNSWEEIVSEFNNIIEQMWQDWTSVTPKQVAQTYVDYKNKLDDYVNNNKIGPEEYKTLLAGLRQNKLLNKLLKR